MRITCPQWEQPHLRNIYPCGYPCQPNCGSGTHKLFSWNRTKMFHLSADEPDHNVQTKYHWEFSSEMVSGYFHVWAWGLIPNINPLADSLPSWVLAFDRGQNHRISVINCVPTILAIYVEKNSCCMKTPCLLTDEVTHTHSKGHPGSYAHTSLRRWSEERWEFSFQGIPGTECAKPKLTLGAFGRIQLKFSNYCLILRVFIGHCRVFSVLSSYCSQYRTIR